MRLIDAEGLKNDLMTFFPDKCLEGITTKILFKQILTDIDNAPTVEEKPQGEWEEPFEHNGKIYHKCNHCHASIPSMVIDNYCSYCGADMRGNENDT